METINLNEHSSHRPANHYTQNPLVSSVSKVSEWINEAPGIPSKTLSKWRVLYSCRFSPDSHVDTLHTASFTNSNIIIKFLTTHNEHPTVLTIECALEVPYALNRSGHFLLRSLNVQRCLNSSTVISCASNYATSNFSVHWFFANSPQLLMNMDWVLTFS